MATSVFVDTVHYDFMGLHDNTQSDDEPMVFHHRADIETFVEKAIEADRSELHQLAGDPTISPLDTAALLEVVSTQIENGALRVQQNASGNFGGGGGGGGSSNGASHAPSADVDRELLSSISDRYSSDMKTFIASHKNNYDKFGGIKSEFLTQDSASSTPAPSTTSSPAPSPTPLPPNTQQELRYKIVVEIAGHHPCAKQLIEINALSTDKSAPREQQAQQNRGVNHNRDNHRGVVEFKKLPNTPRDLALIIPTSGYGSNIRLPLNTTVAPNDNQTEKAEWDNVIVPVKPLAYVTKENQKQQADVLKPGWIYIFWRGKLWRELEVKKNQALRDVNVEYYRRNWNGDFGQEAEREAEGHWQTAAWVPYKLNGEIQSGNNAPLMMYSESQLDWPYVESLEADNAKLLEVASKLDLTAYSQDKHFKNAAGDMGSIEDALLDQYFDPEEHEYLVVSEKGKDLRGYRDTLVPVVYLPVAKDKFILCVQDDKGKKLRNKKVTFDLGGRTIDDVTDRNGIIEITLKDGDSINGTFQLFDDEALLNSSHQGKIEMAQGLIEDVSTVKGQQTRFNNLGYNAGVVDGINGKKTKAAATSFQRDNALGVDGICGPKTQAKLKKIYKQ